MPAIQKAGKPAGQFGGKSSRRKTGGRKNASCSKRGKTCGGKMFKKKLRAGNAKKKEKGWVMLCRGGGVFRLLERR